MGFSLYHKCFMVAGFTLAHNEKNKRSNDMREEILSIACDLKEGSMTLKEAQTQLLRLLNVVGRSESFVCGHPPKQTYLLDGTWHCEKCGGKWESIANK